MAAIYDKSGIFEIKMYFTLSIYDEGEFILDPTLSREYTFERVL